jgi:hypothetical protein
VPEVSVEARQVETNLSSNTITDGEGRFRFPYLQVGNYEVKVTKTGFAAATRKVTLTIGAAFQLPIRLTVATPQETVEVSSEAAVVETARTQIAGTIEQTEVKDLPLNGRSYLDVALLVPGVSLTNTASTQLFPETSAVPGQGISISSQRNFSNSFILDGLSANDDAAGLSGTFYGLDSIQELQVVTSGGQAEFGRALGGYVNMVTKNGTNTLHGSVYGFFRNQWLNAPNGLTGTKAPLTQAQYGASMGGPIVKDRTFYFANFEQRMLNQYGLITIPQTTVDTINAALDAFHYAGPHIATGFLSQSGAQHELSRAGGPSLYQQRPVQYPLQPLSRGQQKLAVHRWHRYGEHRGRTHRSGSNHRRQQHLHVVAAHGERDTGAVHK